MTFGYQKKGTLYPTKIEILIGFGHIWPSSHVFSIGVCDSIFVFLPEGLTNSSKTYVNISPWIQYGRESNITMKITPQYGHTLDGGNPAPPGMYKIW